MRRGLLGESLATRAIGHPVHDKRYASLAIRNAMVIDGNGTPASGPKDILIQNNRIVTVVPLDPVALANGRSKPTPAEVEIDAKGKYVFPGLSARPD